jgi:hypothetical protein
MNKKQKLFAEEYIKHSDAAKAYKKAYPKTNSKSARTSAARLLRRQEIAAFINLGLEPAHKKAMTKLQATATERIKLEMLDTEQRRHACALMVLGKWKVRRNIRLKDQVIEVLDDPSPHAVLRAIELDAKLEHGWYIRDKKTSKGRAADAEPIAPEGCEIVIDGFANPDLKKELQLQWERDNPGKVAHHIIDKNEIFTLSKRQYLEPPPWETDPEWGDKQKPAQPDPQDMKQVFDDPGVNSVAICSKNVIQTNDNQSIESMIQAEDHATFAPKIDTTTPPLNKKKTYWEVTPHERWERYLELNTNLRHYTEEQLRYRKDAYCNMAVKSQIMLITSMEAANNYVSIIKKTG